MALSTKALQRKREKKKKKRTQNKVQQTASAVFYNYSQWPAHECFMPDHLWDSGIGHVIVTRKSPTAEFAIGVYLVDVFCLGVKDCFVHVVDDEQDYQEFLSSVTSCCDHSNPVAADYAHALIQQAVNYAHNLGFKPHADFTKAKSLLKNIPIDETAVFKFGKDNKPLYIPGPNEKPIAIKHILSTLEANCGSDNFHYMLEIEDVKNN